MFKKFIGILLGGILSISMCTTSFAAWMSDGNGWWYDNGNGTWPASCWLWIDGNNDVQAECYYFQQNGYIMLNSTTPDGYIVDGNGAWVVNGVVQKKYTMSNSVTATNTGGLKSSNKSKVDNKKKENKSSHSEKKNANNSAQVDSTSSEEPTKLTKKELDKVALYNLEPVQIGVYSDKRSSERSVQGDIMSNVLIFSDTGYVEYYTGGKYNTLNMIIAAKEGFDQGCGGIIQVVGDNNTVLNESKEISYKTTPFEFNVDISGQDYVRINFIGDNYCFSGRSTVIADNAEFRK